MSDITKMSLLEKITQIKIDIHKEEIHPTGQNDFAKKGLTYYKLEDFIGIVDSLLLQYRVFADIEYDAEYAFLELINIDNEEQRLVKKFYNVDVEDNSFKNNKKANLIQRVNSIQTYQKRYLYMNTFNIGNTEILDFEDEAKDPQNSEELISHHAEMMKKHSFQSSEKIDENKEKLEKEINTIREEQSKKEKREGQVITGNFTKKEEDKTPVEKAIEDTEKRAKENQEPELTVLYIPEDFEEISDEKLVETIIERTKSHLNAESGEAEIKDVRKLFILHKEELNHLKDGRANLADECVKTLAGAK